MRALSLAFAFCFASLSLAALVPLNDFGALMKALREGYSVRVVITYNKTKLFSDGKEEPAPDAIGGMILNPWEYFAKGVVRNERAYVASSEAHLIAHPRFGYVNNYVRLRIYDDNSVEILARYLSLSKTEVLMDETFKGKISNGKDKEGIRLFGQ